MLSLEKKSLKQYHVSFHYVVIFFIRVDGRGPSFEKCKKLNHLIQECLICFKKFQERPSDTEGFYECSCTIVYSQFSHLGKGCGHLFYEI